MLVFGYVIVTSIRFTSPHITSLKFKVYVISDQVKLMEILVVVFTVRLDKTSAVTIKCHFECYKTYQHFTLIATLSFVVRLVK